MSTALHDVHGELKPRLRGLVHSWSVLPIAAAGLLLTIAAPGGAARASVAVYGIAITGMLAASAAYHRLRVGQSMRNWLRRLDHSMIGVAVAGTYTPVIVLTLEGSLRAALLVLLWSGALGAMLLSFLWPTAPRWLRAGVYVALGWAGAVVTPWLWSNGGPTAFLFVMIGAALYSFGAIVYARRSPNPWPRVYGFHEVFHTAVVLAVLAHFTAVWLVVQNAA